MGYFIAMRYRCGIIGRDNLNLSAHTVDIKFLWMKTVNHIKIYGQTFDVGSWDRKMQIIYNETDQFQYI